MHLSLRAFEPTLDIPLDTSGQLLAKSQFVEVCLCVCVRVCVCGGVEVCVPVKAPNEV